MRGAFPRGASAATGTADMARRIATTAHALARMSPGAEEFRAVRT